MDGLCGYFFGRLYDLNGLVRLIDDGLTELEYIVSIIFTSQQEQKWGERGLGKEWGGEKKKGFSFTCYMFNSLYNSIYI